MEDSKYIVFKREEWEAFWGEDFVGVESAEPLQLTLEGHHLDDAVVIRKQDIFAGPALHAYASSISTVIEVLELMGVAGALDDLEEVRDYFFEAALEADDVRTKKVPD